MIQLCFVVTPLNAVAATVDILFNMKKYKDSWDGG